ncbi:MAG: hypothetical protein LBJ33_10785, partial [Pseudomonas putida]|nr:hypothetical protein [Pseudomonas putida]
SLESSAIPVETDEAWAGICTAEPCQGIPTEGDSRLSSTIESPTEFDASCWSGFTRECVRVGDTKT